MISIIQLPGVIEGLRACLEAELVRRAADGGAEWGPGASVQVRPGERFAPYLSTAEDECKCGIGWVRLVSVAGPTGEGDAAAQFRNADGDLCGPFTWTVTFEMGVQRCPTLGDAHRNPTGAESLADTLRQLSDLRAMRAAMRCCFDSVPIVPGEYTPIGPEGMCFGGSWTFTAEFDDCDDCATEE